MKESLYLKLEKLTGRQEELEGLLSDPDIINNQNKFRELSQENDKELQELAIEELKKAEIESKQLENKLQILLLPKDPNDSNNIFLEIRAGTGGEEAALFSGDLMRM